MVKNNTALIVGVLISLIAGGIFGYSFNSSRLDTLQSNIDSLQGQLNDLI